MWRFARQPGQRTRWRGFAGPSPAILRGMWPLSQQIHWRFSRTRVAAFDLLMAGAWASGCGGGAGFVQPPPPPPITVSIVPPSGSVLLGNMLTFTAAVQNTTDTSVNWSVNGVAGGNSTVGTISTGG